jgi:hypothetical protein
VERRSDGLKVEARDGSISQVDEATHEAGGSFIVIDTDPWIFGKKVMLPGRRDPRHRPQPKTGFVDLTKDEIKNAPEFDEKTYRERSYRNELGKYYGGRREARSGERM